MKEALRGVALAVLCCGVLPVLVAVLAAVASAGAAGEAAAFAVAGAIGAAVLIGRRMRRGRGGPRRRGRAADSPRDSV